MAVVPELLLHQYALQFVLALSDPGPPEARTLGVTVSLKAAMLYHQIAAHYDKNTALRIWLLTDDQSAKSREGTVVSSADQQNNHTVVKQ